jgi:hypothetical protein
MFVSPHPFSARRTHERVGQTIERLIESPLADAVSPGASGPQTGCSQSPNQE